MIYKLKPACVDYLWGGTKLKTKYGKQSDKDIIAETWELSCHKDGQSTVEETGETLSELLVKNPEYVGKACDKFEDFPILIKLIDAKQALSIQVHPSDEYALANEKQFGKTEMWYVVDCEKDAFLYYGFKEKCDKETFKTAIENSTVCDLLNKVYVKPGDVFFIEAGTIHAIGAGILIAEVQQNSNVTYRVYDFDRVGVDGNKRELHVEKACEVTNYNKQETTQNASGVLASCEYFTVEKINLDGENINKAEKSFHSLLVTNGSGEITCDEQKINFNAGDSIFIPANSSDYTLAGKAEIILSYVM